MEQPSDQFNLPESDVPSVDAYKEAFLACRGALRRAAGRSPVEEMLKAHYYAPDHTLTAGELAEHAQVDLASYRAVNTQYGKYAKALCEHLNLRPKNQLAILLSFSDGAPGDEDVKWTMLPQVAAALESLVWVKKS